MVKRPTNKVKGASDCKFSSIYKAKQHEKWRCEQIVLAVSIFARQRFMTIDVFPEFQAVRSYMLQTLGNGRYSFLSLFLQHFKTIIKFDTEKCDKNKIFCRSEMLLEYDRMLQQTLEFVA